MRLAVLRASLQRCAQLASWGYLRKNVIPRVGKFLAELREAGRKAQGSAEVSWPDRRIPGQLDPMKATVGAHRRAETTSAALHCSREAHAAARTSWTTLLAHGPQAASAALAPEPRVAGSRRSGVIEVQKSRPAAAILWGALHRFAAALRRCLERSLAVLPQVRRSRCGGKSDERAAEMRTARRGACLLLDLDLSTPSTIGYA